MYINIFKDLKFCYDPVDQIKITGWLNHIKVILLLELKTSIEKRIVKDRLHPGISQLLD